jgi:hypothetical protein
VWLGEYDAARAILAREPIGKQVLDHHLPGTVAWAAELAWRLRDRGLAAELYEWVRREDPPLPAIHVHGFAVGHPMAHSAMVLAATLGDLDAARRHFNSGLAVCRNIGAKPLEAHLCHVFAKITQDTGEARELAAHARALADAIGMALDMREPAQAAIAAPAVVRLREDGEYWVAEGFGAACRLKGSRGVEMLAKLLAEPGREVHVLELAGADVVDSGDSGELLDPEAKRAYRTRITELRDQLDEAEQWNDAARAERARLEIEALESEIARAVGLGGRDRRVGKAAERARSNVQRRLSDAVKRIAELQPELGRHLGAAVRTGTYCSYTPERATRSR